MIYSTASEATLEVRLNRRTIGGQWAIVKVEHNGREAYQVVRVEAEQRPAVGCKIGPVQEA